MSKNATTLRPGMLVSLHTRLQGGVQYTRVDLDADKAPEDRAAVERWETTKVTTDPEEHARAVKVRNKASSLIRSTCIQTAFGLLCPTANEAKLDLAIREANDRIERFNASATTTRIGVFVLKGYIVESDTEAVRALGGELRELFDTIKEGVGEANVKKIRDAADRAKSIGAMLDAEAGQKVQAAVEEARSVARKIVKQLSEGSQQAFEFATTANLEAIERARFAFLDMEASAPVAAEDALPVVEARALDLEDEELPAPKRVERDDSEDKVAASGGEARFVEV